MWNSCKHACDQHMDAWIWTSGMSGVQKVRHLTREIPNGQWTWVIDDAG